MTQEEKALFLGKKRRKILWFQKYHISSLHKKHVRIIN